MRRRCGGGLEVVVGAVTGPIVRWGAVVGLGVVWWWAVLRLLLSGDAGVLEGTVAAGGWGLSVLPVHCVLKERPGEGRDDAAPPPHRRNRPDGEPDGQSID
ncbi:hypothetical protein ACFYNZ_23065 [Streptomyces kebangsaanensis]|uniref:Uncharacterized protein n=1 Tax=Streptomyces kebangsaanensis TaxID=864058 RepID=A0ABW6KWQ1_9ACTN